MVKMLKMPFLIMFLVFLGIVVTQSVAQTTESSPKGIHLELIRSGFSEISDLYVSPAGMLYVMDSQSQYVYRINIDSGVIDSLGGRGSGTTQFNTPVGVHATNDLRIFVNDAGNGRIQVFDRRFQSMGSIMYPSGSRSRNGARGIHLTRDGRVVFWDSGASKLVGTQANFEIDALYRPDVSSLGQDVRSVRSGNGEFLVLDSSGKRVFRYQDNGRYVGFWEWEEPILDIRASSGGYILLTNDELVSLSGAWQPMLRMGHGEGGARVVFRHNQWVYVATENAVYRTLIES
jgi:hypothetical protein